jgi:hypothetical protein
MITFPHSALRTTIFFGFSKLIFCGSKFFTNKHLFFITTVKPKAKIPSTIKKIKINFSCNEALTFFNHLKYKSIINFF